MSSVNFEFGGRNIEVSTIKQSISANISFDSSTILFKYPCFGSNDCTGYFVSLYAGAYIFNVWGAQGGKGVDLNPSEGGLGGFASGIIRLNSRTNIYIHVGNIGSDGGSGGYNGGGSTPLQGLYISGSGGGATDIRILEDNLSYRVIVGGGGGGSEHSSVRSVSSYGGGIEGGNSSGAAITKGVGGTQKSGGINGGKFGLGGNCSLDDRGGGGGGWYGGGCGNTNSDGGGGSGFVFSSIPQISDPFLLSNEYMLTNPYLISGDNSIYNPITKSAFIGNQGPGMASITLIQYFGCSQCYMNRLCNAKPFSYGLLLFSLLDIIGY